MADIWSVAAQDVLELEDPAVNVGMTAKQLKEVSIHIRHEENSCVDDRAIAFECYYNREKWSAIVVQKALDSVHAAMEAE